MKNIYLIICAYFSVHINVLYINFQNFVGFMLYKLRYVENILICIYIPYLQTDSVFKITIDVNS